jgi:hypothetical protein
MRPFIGKGRNPKAIHPVRHVKGNRRYPISRYASAWPTYCLPRMQPPRHCARISNDRPVNIGTTWLTSCSFKVTRGRLSKPALLVKSLLFNPAARSCFCHFSQYSKSIRILRPLAVCVALMEPCGTRNLLPALFAKQHTDHLLPTREGGILHSGISLAAIILQLQ